MPNVRLRTIINQDNSTTFQVQFHEGGEWEDLTWDMISQKPFETLDDTVFLVDENGVLTITDIHTVSNWSDVLDKPFIFLDPDDFSVSESGVLSYTGSLDWSSIVGKPFNTLNNNDFEIQNGQLSVKHQIIPNQNWSQIQSKPFTSLDPSSFQVVGGVLYLNLNPEIPYWAAIQQKPFTYLDNNDFAVIGDTLKVKHQTIPDQNWSQIQQKPFETLDSNDFSTDAQGKMSVNFPTPDWDDLTGRPFETLNSSDFSVDADNELSVNFPTPTPDDWQDVTGKPFESIGSGLSVDQDGVLSATGGGGNPDWLNVQNKPFSTLGGDFYAYNGALRSSKMFYMSNSMDNDHKITSLNDLRSFVLNYVLNSMNYCDGKIAQPANGYWGQIFTTGEKKESKLLFHKVAMKLDNTGELSSYSDRYDIIIIASGFQIFGGLDCFINVYGLPNFDDPNTLINLNGYVNAYLSGNTWVSDGSMVHMYQNDSSRYYFS